MEFEEILSSLPEKEGNGLYRKDFLRTWDMSDEDIRLILSSAEALKNMRDRNVSSKVFDSGIAVSMFNNSRNMGMEFAFASGCDMLRPWSRIWPTSSVSGTADILKKAPAIWPEWSAP